MPTLPIDTKYTFVLRSRSRRLVTIAPARHLDPFRRASRRVPRVPRASSRSPSSESATIAATRAATWTSTTRLSLAPLLRDVLRGEPAIRLPPRHPRSVPFRLPRHHRVLRESLPPRTNANRREGHPRGFERRASGSAEQPTRLRRQTQTPVARMDRLRVLRRGPARFVLRLLLLFCPYIFLLKHRRRHHLRGGVARARARGHDSVFERLL